MLRPHSRRPRGSALITVTIICACLVLLVGSILRYALTERRLNTRHAARIEARNAAESLAEYGAAQIRQKYETRGTFTLNPNGTDALRQPPSSFWAGGRVVTSASDLSAATYPPAASLDLELIGGTERSVTTGTSSLYFVDPADENNRGDPLSGKWVTRRDVSVIARASVRPIDGGRPITAYVSERISVRGAPLFAHAIFYNMDLEIFNGPPMNITGPVHTNGNLYLYPDNNSSLNFYGNVTATGNIYKAKKPGDGSGDGASATTRNGSINFLNKAGALVNLYGKDLTRPASSPGPDFWRDSTGFTGTSGTSFANFAANASQAWNGYLQTKDHGIQNYTPVAIGKYVEDPTPANGVDNSVNTGRAIIEPPAIPLGSDPDYALKMEVEKQKYANMAGLYITVTPGTGNITLARRGIDTDGSLKSTKTLTMPGNQNLVKFIAYRETTVAKSSTKITSGTNKNKYNTVTTTTVTTTAGATTTTDTEITNSAVTSSTTTTLEKGMYDKHRDKPLDLVELDIAALRDAVAEMQKDSGSRDAAKAVGNFESADWSGVVYVDVTGGPVTRIVDESSSLPAGSTVAATNALNKNTAVRITNGSGKAPSYGSANPGLTIASNAPVYMKGNFNTTNANGTDVSSTSTNNPATDYESGEVPCAIVSDAITVLSNGFNDSTSKSSPNLKVTSDIVISAAFLTGIAPTNKNNNGATSGGAHNIVRFLEDWSNGSGVKYDTWFRGSLVCLFESRVFTEPHGGGYYSPPNRNWGFNKLFGQGTYPPGTPRVLSYRRVDFTDLTAAEYATTRDSFNWK